jgi:hypothetical protein
MTSPPIFPRPPGGRYRAPTPARLAAARRLPAEAI